MDISPAIKEAFTKITAVQAFILAGLAIVLIWGMPPLVEYLDSSGQREEERYKMEYKVRQDYERRQDSINEVRRIEKSNMFVFKNNQIHDLMSYLERRLPLSTHVSVFSLHNGGKTPRTSKTAETTLLYTTDNIRGINMLKTYKNYPNYPGYAEYYYQMLQKRGKGYYVKDVTKFPAIYNGESRKNMDKIGTKSMYGAWIKTSTTATFYITVSFPIVDGMNHGGTGYKEVLIQDARDRLVELLDTEAINFEQ